jgi:hypothetical protein
MTAETYLLRGEGTCNAGRITENAYTSDSQESEILPMTREQEGLHSGGIGSLHRYLHVDES